MMRRTELRASSREQAGAILSEKGSVSARELAQRAKCTFAAAQRMLERMRNAGELLREGKRGQYRYRRNEGIGARLQFRPLPRSSDEAFSRLAALAPWLQAVPPAGHEALRYVFRQLVGNVAVHADSPELDCAIHPIRDAVELEVADLGPGAFEHLRRALSLPTVLDAALEIAKGPVTARPDFHAGEGLFFVPRLAASFRLEANGVAWVMDRDRDDYTLTPSDRREGTRVLVRIEHRPRAPLAELFAAHADGPVIARTRTHVKLFEWGGRFVSRSQAQRFVHGLGRFREVTLDFTGVEGVGAAFCDEVFGVWAPANPDTRLVVTGMNETVAALVDRARRAVRSGA